MDTRRSYDYAKPTTLIAIITDALEHLHPTVGSQTHIETKAIVSDAWDALVANVGIDDAVEMAMNAGISLDKLGALAY